MADINLSRIFPQGKMLIEDEEHRFIVYEKENGDPNPLREYTLDKAPIIELVRVEGTSSGRSTEFEKGVDYELSADDERIVWQGNAEPDADTKFRVTYRSEPLIQRYTGGVEEQYEKTEEELIHSAIQGKFVDSAEGVELDNLGTLFGPVIGARRGRGDDSYRRYLKSVVQSFVSRGTVDGIKLAVSTATDVDVDNITINEDFTNNEYEVILDEGTGANAALISDIAEIADPSGVKQIDPRIDAATDTVVVSDNTSVTEDDVVNRWNTDHGLDSHWAPDDDTDSSTDEMYWA